MRITFNRCFRFLLLLCIVVGVPCGASADPPPNHPVDGHIGAKYKELKGSAGPLGRPTSKAMHQNEGEGLYQTFEHGVIGWSPSTGKSSVQAAYIKNSNLHFEWSGMGPQNNTNWMVRWDLNGKNVGQAESINGGGQGFVIPNGIKGTHSGAWISKNPNPGKYRLVVQGGHLGLNSSDWHGWSNPLYIRFTYPKR